jgi:hypothetical protein
VPDVDLQLDAHPPDASDKVKHVWDLTLEEYTAAMQKQG